MLVSAQAHNDRSLSTHMSFTSFLAGPVISHQTVLNNDCEPEEILRDYLPADYAELDEEELHQAVEEACLLAASVEPAGQEPVYEPLRLQSVRLSKIDLQEFRRIFLRRDFGLVMTGSFGPDAA